MYSRGINLNSGFQSFSNTCEEEDFKNYFDEFQGSIKDKYYFYNEFKRGSVIRPLFLQIRQDLDDLEEDNDNSNSKQEKHVISLSRIVRENIQIRFKFEKTLGEGAFGKVK